ncbi:hypothetical protein ZWY2020_018202 [Hordeum vulgare]|nr:hypothetical protein ZWY2020_018202 [Hordeum vulgare]
MAQTVGQRLGGYAEELENLLQTLGGYEHPRYRSRRDETDGIQAGVVTQLRLRSVQQHHPRRRANIHLAIRRCSFEMGVQDLARRALLRLCATHSDYLRETEYRYFLYACVPDTAPDHGEMAEGEGAAMRALGRLARAQSRVAESVAEELTDVYGRLDDAQRRIVELEERLHGDAPPPAPEPIPVVSDSENPTMEDQPAPALSLAPAPAPAATGISSFAPAALFRTPAPGNCGWLDD